ncbi:hypothetical protein ACD578_05435 [Microvirga sp. RSM25]|uniref:hypothetical protein n=1 Tax=Microvirga sp. RSM25 TaxID=3273802 RepID=UPI00384F7CD4
MPEMTSAPIKIEYLPQAGKPIEEIVTLDYPFTYGERHVSALTVRRMTVAQVDAVVAALKAGESVGLAPHMVTFPDGEPVPAAVIAALMDDDDARLFEVMQSFLPRRLRPVFAPTPPSADDTSLPSQAD